MVAFPMRMSTLLRISRPRFWMYTAGPFLLGYIGGLQGGWQGIYPFPFWLLFAYYLLPANLLLYGVNDWFDAETDALNAKKDEHEHRLQSTERRGLLVTLGICAVISVVVMALMPPQAWLLQVLFIGLSIFYSAPPLRLKTWPTIDSYSNALYIIPGVIGYIVTAGKFPPVLMIAGGVAWAAGMHAYSAIPDIEPDRDAGIATIAVMLGKTGTLLFVGGNWLFFALMTMWVIGAAGAITLIYPLLIVFLLLRPRVSVTRVYWWLPVLNGLMGFAAFVHKTLFM